MAIHSCRIAAISVLLGLAGISGAAAEDLVFMLDNQSSSAVAEFYASPTNVEDWEDDILGTDTLASGAATRVTIADGRSQCVYDLKFVFKDGSDLEEDEIDLCDTGSYTITD